MKKHYVLLFLIFSITCSVNSQVQHLVNLASKYATLLQSHKNDVVFEHENLHNEMDSHLHVAIIPFVSEIVYAKPAELDEEEALDLFETQQMLGKLMQEQFWDVFDNYDSEIYLQDIRITNKVLEDVGYFVKKDQFPPAYLAKLLNVDAVIICTFEVYVDNTRTGWQNMTKALGDIALTQVKGSVPGLSALKYIKNPQAIIDIVSNPGDFFKKLKAGDIGALATLAGTMLPEGNWSKVADIAIKNSATISKVSKGDFSNLFSDLVSNNMEFLAKELKLNPQVSRLIVNNSKVVDKIVSGNTQGLMFDIISSNVSAVAETAIGSRNTVLTNAINSNSTVIAKLATGDTKGIMQEVLQSNLSQLSNYVPGDKVGYYSNLILGNQQLISKVIRGDMDGVFQEFIATNIGSASGFLPEDVQKYAGLFQNKEAISGLLSGDVSSIQTTLIEQGTVLFGNAFEGTDVGKFSGFITENKEMLSNVLQGNMDGVVEGLLASNAFHGVLPENVGQYTSLLKNRDAISGLLSGDSASIQSLLIEQGSALFGQAFEGAVAAKFSGFLVENKQMITQVMSGDTDGILQGIMVAAAGKASEGLNAENIGKYGEFLKNKEALAGLAGGDVTVIQTTLTERGTELFGAAFETVDVAHFSGFLTQNQTVVSALVTGDTGTVLGTLLKSNNNLLGTAMEQEEILGLASIVTEKSGMLQGVLDGSADGILSSLIQGQNIFDAGVNSAMSLQVASLVLNNKEFLPAVLKADRAQVLQLVGNDASIANLLIDNRSKLNQLVGLENQMDFSLLGKNDEDMQVLAFNIFGNGDVLGGILAGNTQDIIDSYTDEDLRTMGIDRPLLIELAENLVQEKSHMSEVIVNSQINEMLLNGTIDIQFFDFGKDALLADYENVYLRDKTVSQTVASILDPTLDPKDRTLLSINIFGKSSNDVLWQYIYEDGKARIYDMEKTIGKVVKRLNKKFPYFD